MIRNNKRIEIVRSSTKALSSMSEESSASIVAVLSKYFSEVGVTIVNNLSDLENLVSRRPDLVFLGMEYIPKEGALATQAGNRIWLSSYFEDHGIPYTGSEQPAHLLQRNKQLAKRRLLELNLSTPPFCVIRSGQLPQRADIKLNYPLFVKPTNKGGGCGIDSNSIVYNFEQLSSKVRSIGAIYQADSMIEEFLPGREFSVAVLKDDSSDDFLLMPIELIAPIDKNGMRILSAKVKTDNNEQAIKIDDEALATRVKEFSLEIFKALGARDYGRIDIRIDKNGVLHFLEANLIPSLTSGYGSFPKACMLNLGIDYQAMILRITKLGLEHVYAETSDIPISTSTTETSLTYSL